jgi:ABC-type phosphate/phosphonate transport system ATPase subunit
MVTPRSNQVRRIKAKDGFFLFSYNHEVNTMKEYTFRVILVARAKTVEEAWEEALITFMDQIPSVHSSMVDYDEEEIEEPDLGLAGIPC